jgi:hypothetical protein
MSIIVIPINYESEKGEKNLMTLFDSGANLSCISEKYFNVFGPTQKIKTKRLSTASSENFIEVNYKVILEFEINDVQLSDEFLIVPNLSEDAIIGAATMQKWRIKLDFEHDVVIVDPKVAKLQIV